MEAARTGSKGKGAAHGRGEHQGPVKNRDTDFYEKETREREMRERGSKEGKKRMRVGPSRITKPLQGRGKCIFLENLQCKKAKNTSFLTRKLQFLSYGTVSARRKLTTSSVSCGLSERRPLSPRQRSAFIVPSRESLAEVFPLQSCLPIRHTLGPEHVDGNSAQACQNRPTAQIVA